MRIIIFLFFSLLLAMPAFSQQPSRKEMQAQMLEMANEMKKQIAGLEKQITDAKANKEDGETIEDLQRQLAILKKQVASMEGLNKGFSNMPERTFQQAAELEKSKKGIPVRDNKRINMLSKKILTDIELTVFVKKVQLEVERLLPTKEKTEALKIYTAAKSDKKSSDYICNIASSLWMVGYAELAIYILGKECVADMKNTNNLNNYAAFLTMAGAEHAALPILQNLNKKYPGNSTILNNMGQAWYGLGEMNNANRFLDSAVALYPRHSQANQTKSEIQESEGNIEESIESIKRSIQEHYTTEKETRLNKLGGTLKYEDLPFRYPMKAEPLGIEKFLLIIPNYTSGSGMEAAISYMEWEDFKKKLRAAENKINDQLKLLNPKAEAYMALFLANPMIAKPYSNPVFRTATRKLHLLFEWKLDRMKRLGKKMKEAKDSVAEWHEEYSAAVAVHINYNNHTLGIPGDCGVIGSLTQTFNRKANALLHQRNNEYLSFLKQYLNTYANLALYTSTDQSLYEVTIAAIKLELLDFMALLPYAAETGCIPSAPEEHYAKELPDYDSLTCKYKDDIFIPPFVTIKTECNKMTTEFNIDTELGIKFKAICEENLNINGLEFYNINKSFTKATLEIAYEKGINEGIIIGPDNIGFDLQNIGGPFKGELKVEGAIGIEFTQEGIKEVYIKGGISGELTGYIPGDESLPGYVEGNKDFMESKGSSAFNLEMKSSWNSGAKGKESTLSTGLSGEGLSSGGLFKDINWTTPQIKSN